MAEGGEDPQRLKKIAAAAYDYENDARWADYWSNVLIPPHMASRPEVVDHFKRKFYQRYIVRTIFPLQFAYLSFITFEIRVLVSLVCATDLVDNFES